MENEKAHANDHNDATVTRGAQIEEKAHAKGNYKVACIDKDGNLKWEDEVQNVVTTVGRNLALDTFLAGAAYTVVGPFLGLMSSVGFGAGPVAADTMASHAGWTEAGGTNAPTYTSPRKTAAWSAASAASKSLSAPLSYAITSTGTVKGCFMVYGPGAVSTIDSTAGVLYSAGVFSGGDKPVGNGDTLNVTFAASM